MKKEIQSAQQNRQLNQDQCTALGREFEAKGNEEISRSNVTANAKVASQAKLKKDVVARAEKITDCKQMLLLY